MTNKTNAIFNKVQTVLIFSGFQLYIWFYTFFKFCIQMSGVGRELGEYGLDAYTEVKTVTIGLPTPALQTLKELYIYIYIYIYTAPYLQYH